MSHFFAVKVCIDCPFCDIGFDMQWGEHGACRFWNTNREPMASRETESREPPPDWCPLRTGPMTLELDS